MIIIDCNLWLKYDTSCAGLRLWGPSLTALLFVCFPSRLYYIFIIEHGKWANLMVHICIVDIKGGLGSTILLLFLLHFLQIAVNQTQNSNCGPSFDRGVRRSARIQKVSPSQMPFAWLHIPMWVNHGHHPR